MAPSITCLLALIGLQVTLITAEKTNVCEDIPSVALNLTGKRRWYYCETSSDGADNGCFIDVDPQPDGSNIYKRTRYNKQTNKTEVRTFSVNASEDNDVRTRSVHHVQIALSSDENCMLVLKCWSRIRPFLLFVCRTKEGCRDDSYQAFVDEEIKKLKKFDVRTTLKKYYDEELCGE